MEALCPELDIKEVNRLIKRIYDRTGSSARIRELEDADQPVGFQGTYSLLDGDPNNLAGVNKCPNCVKEACAFYLEVGFTDEERFSVFRRKAANWKSIEHQVGGRVKRDVEMHVAVRRWG